MLKAISSQLHCFKRTLKHFSNVSVQVEVPKESATFEIPAFQKTSDLERINPEMRKITLVKQEWDKKQRRIGAIARKIGMMSIIDDWGTKYGATVLQILDCQAFRAQKNQDKRYYAEVCAGKKSIWTMNKSLCCIFFQKGIYPRRNVKGFRVSRKGLLPLGTPIYASHFIPGQTVTVQGTSVGKGFQGWIKRWGFNMQSKTHGNSLSHRHGGASSSSGLGKVWKGKKMPGNMGNETTTIHNLKILKIDHCANLIFVKGDVPGARKGIVYIRDGLTNPLFETVSPPFPTYIPGVHPPRPEIEYAPLPKNDPLYIPEEVEKGKK